MKEQAVHFQTDVDKVDVVRLALQAAHMARNNSFARHPAKVSSGKSNLKYAKSKFTVTDVPGNPEVTEIIPTTDHIPPSGVARSKGAVTFALMGVSSTPSMTEIVPSGPLFDPLPEDSPLEQKTAPGDWCITSESLGTVNQNLAEDRGHANEIGELKDETGDHVLKEVKDVDFQEASHYANDLATAHSLVDGMSVSVAYPLESYVRAAMKTIENCRRPDLLWSNNQRPAADSGIEETPEL